MQAQNLKELVRSGSRREFAAGQMVYSLDFSGELHYIEKGYVKRYSVKDADTRSLQAIYGPGFFFPLTPILNKVSSRPLGEERATYVYEALTDTEICSIENAKLDEVLDQNPILYRALLAEAARRMRSNIHSLENNALPGAYEKIAHLLVFLAEEFWDSVERGVRTNVSIPFALSPQDYADQTNERIEDVEQALERLAQMNLIAPESSSIGLSDINMLKDVYL